MQGSVPGGAGEADGRGDPVWRLYATYARPNLAWAALGMGSTLLGRAVGLIPAYVISELRAAFIMGFVIFVPFLIIDLVVAAVLMSMGMMMLPPVFVSLPFKIIMFVLADGWYLLIQELVSGFY